MTRTCGGYFGKGSKELEHGTWKSKIEKEAKPNQGCVINWLSLGKTLTVGNSNPVGNS